MHLTRRQVVAALAATPFAPRAKAHDGHVHHIEIRGFKFDPATLNVKPGDRVRWTNLDIAPHTATATDHSWDSGPLERGESWEWVVPATFAGDYYCVFHPMMRAQLVPVGS